MFESLCQSFVVVVVGSDLQVFLNLWASWSCRCLSVYSLFLPLTTRVICSVTTVYVIIRGGSRNTWAHVRRYLKHSEICIAFTLCRFWIVFILTSVDIELSFGWLRIGPDCFISRHWWFNSSLTLSVSRTCAMHWTPSCSLWCAQRSV